MPSPPSNGPYGASTLSIQGALWTLLGIGGVLAGALLFDTYVDWIHQGDFLWSTAFENSIPVLLALALPAAGWRLYQRKDDPTFLTKAAKWAVVGCAGTIILSGLAVGVQAFQQETKFHIVVLQLATVGAVGGLLIGLNIARTQASERIAQEERDRLKNLFKGLPAAVVHGTFDGDRLTILAVNRAFEEVFGHSSEEVEGENLYDLVVPEEKREEAAEIDRKALEHGLVETEVRRLTSEGLRNFQHRVAPALNHDSAETYAVYTDITEQKRRESELRLFKQVVDQVKDAILVTEAEPLDEPGPRIEYVNCAFEEMTGYSREEVIGKTPRILQGPETDRAVLDSLREALEQERSWSGETINYRKDGTPFILQWSIAPVRNGEGQIEYWASVQRDVTRQRRQEQEVRRRSDAMDAASDGMAILDSDGVYIYVNQAHAVIYGYDSPEAFLGESWKICYSEEELRRFEKEVMPTFFEEGQWRGRVTGRRKDGSAFPQELTLNMLEDGGLVCVVRDITDQIERERQLQQAKEEAEEASRLKSSMLANMSHELRTPLTSITGFSEMLKENLEGNLEDFASKIHGGSRRLQRTLESVLHLSQLEAGVNELDREHLSLGEVAGEIVEMLSEEASEKALTVETEVPPEPAVGYWNEDAVHRICRNLVENAIKFTPDGGRVEVRVERGDEEALLQVEDTGIGMDPEHVPELFRAFRQESEGLRREYEGTGLGLSIVKRLTEELGGTVEVDTEKGEGSCFTVRLPLT